MPLVSIGDCELQVWSEGDGAPLLLVAGLGGRGAFWDPHIRKLAEQFRVVTHDQRGTGGSSRWVGRYSVSRLANDVLQLMDALEIARADFVGHSTGGAIGQHIALHAPDRLRSLVLSGTWCGPDSTFLRTFELRRKVLEDCGAREYYALGALLAFPPAWIAKHPEILGRKLSDTELWYPGLEIEAARLEAVMQHDLRDRVGGIRTPTFVLGAGDDQLTPEHFQRELAERVRGARLHVFPKGGHFFPRTRPDEFCDRVLSFLGVSGHDADSPG